MTLNIKAVVLSFLVAASLSACGGGGSSGSGGGGVPSPPAPPPPPPPPSSPPLSMTDVVYATGSVDGGNAEVELLLDVYQSGQTCGVPRPVVLLVHGGGFTGGSKSAELWREIGAAVADRGFVGISIDYRIFSDDPEISSPYGTLRDLILENSDVSDPTTEQLQYVDTVVSSVEDARKALDWVVDHSDEICADADRIAIWGASAGATIAMTLGYVMDDAELEATNQLAVIDYYGSLIVPDTIRSDDSPLLILHGNADLTVEYSEALSIQDELELAQLPYSFYTVDRAGHGKDEVGVFTNGVDGKSFLEITLDFVEDHLTGGSPHYEQRTVPSLGRNFVQDFESAQPGVVSPEALDSLFPDSRDINGVSEGRVFVTELENLASERVLEIRVDALNVGADNSGASWITPISRRNEFYLSYRVQFADGFDFDAGGTLPGLAGGNLNTVNSWSAPIVWRPSGTIAQRLTYFEQTNPTGDIFLPNVPVSGPWNFDTGEWYSVLQFIRMNTPGEADGLVEVSVNGENIIQIDGINLREFDNLYINKLVFSAYFGGGEAHAQPINDSEILFDDLIMSTQPVEEARSEARGIWP